MPPRPKSEAEQFVSYYLVCMLVLSILTFRREWDAEVSPFAFAGRCLLAVALAKGFALRWHCPAKTRQRVAWVLYGVFAAVFLYCIVFESGLWMHLSDVLIAALAIEMPADRHRPSDGSER